MHLRRLGKTELMVSEVGLGGAPLAREGVSDAEAIWTVWTALDAGVNLVDTSPHYGLGRSETLIGRALAERPELKKGLILSTKTGHYGAEKDYSYERTRRSVATSLQRLGVDRVDILHIHDVQEAEHMRELLKSQSAYTALREYQEEGVIGFIGVGTRSLEVLQVVVESGAFDCFMMANQLNLIEQAGAPIVQAALRADIGVLIAGAYATGILAKGSADPNARYRYQPASDAVRQRVAAIEELCARWGVALPAAAVQFCLRYGEGQTPPNVVAVLGARTPEQAAAIVETVAKRAPEGFWQELDEFLARSEMPQ
ncbi:MAG: aldo/keto reductase [Chloroflexi bacterium]|nr:aldo/keto reductase [Chloroflexota bacterium]